MASVDSIQVTHFEGPAGFVQQLQVLVVRDDSLSEVNRAVDDALFLLSLQDAWDDGLGGDAVAPVVHYNCPQRVQTLHVYRSVSPDSVQVVSGCGVSGSITAQLAVVVPHVEAQAEEDVVPDEHLHAGLLTWVDGHHVAVYDCHCTASCSGSKVTVNLSKGNISYHLTSIIVAC